MKVKLSLAILCMMLAPSSAQNLRNLGITPTTTSLTVGTPTASTPEVGNIVIDQKTTLAPAASTTQPPKHPEVPVDPRFKAQNSTEHLNGTDSRSWAINGTKSENTSQKVTAESIKAKEDQLKGWKPEKNEGKQFEDKQGSSSPLQEWREEKFKENGQKRDVSQQEHKPRGFEQQDNREGPQERKEGKFIQRGQEREFFKGDRKGEKNQSEKGRKDRKHSDERQLKIRGDFTHLEVEFGSVDHDGSSEDRSHGRDERKSHEEEGRLHEEGRLPEEKGHQLQKGQQGHQIENKSRDQSGPNKLYIPNDRNNTGKETQVHPQASSFPQRQHQETGTNQTQQASAVKKQGEDSGQYFQQFNQNLQIFEPLHQQPKQGELPQHQAQPASVQKQAVNNSTVVPQPKPAA